MVRRFRNFRSNMIRSGRKTFWFAGQFNETNLAGASSAVLVTSLNAAALSLRPFTVIRTRGVWGAFSDQIGTDESQVVSYGSIVVSDEAVAVGISAVSNPVEQSSSPWIHYSTTIQRLQFESAIGFSGNHIPWNMEIDSKSMRKVEEGQDLITVIQNASFGDGAEVTTFVKVLIKLH